MTGQHHQPGTLHGTGVVIGAIVAATLGANAADAVTTTARPLVSAAPPSSGSVRDGATP